MSPPRLWGRDPVRMARPFHKITHIKTACIEGEKTPAAINKWVNRQIRYRKDKRDFWDDPKVTLARGSGDCEDIALVKIAMLQSIGVPAWLLVVYDKLARMHHAVALTQADILDLHVPRLLPIEIVPDYRPILALTPRETWLYGKVAA